MLIRSLRAENFMRFSRLEVRDLPASGIIGIEGPNESGKTTLGEVLLFALFGKTRLSTGAPAMSLIRWGSESMSVEVEFGIEGSAEAASPAEASPLAEGSGHSLQPGNYLLYRQIDKGGTNYVKVVRLPSRSEIASGNIQVAQFVARQVRFDFHEFQSSFYFDQCESRRIQASHAAFIEAAAGIKHLREAAAASQQELGGLEREFSYYQKEISRNLLQIEKYGKNAAKLANLGERSSRVQESLLEGGRGIAERRKALEDLRAEAALRQERAKRVDGFLTMPLDGVPAEAEKLLGGEDAVSRKASPADPGARSPGGSWREGLLAIEGLARGLVDLRRAIRDELAEIDERLDEGSKDGLLASKAALETAEARSQRRARARTAAGVALLAGGLVFSCLVAFDLATGLFAARTGAPLGWIIGAAVALGGITLSTLALASATRHRKEGAISAHSVKERALEIETMRASRGKLATLLELEAVTDAARLVGAAEACEARAVRRNAQELREKNAADLEADGERGLRQKIGMLAKADRDARSRLLSEAQKIEKALQEEEAQAKKLQVDRDRIDGELRECQSQASKKEVLEEKNRELEKAAEDIRSEIDLRVLAARLIEDTISSIQGQVGPALTRFVKNVLPRITSGRYRDAKVESNLEIKVFSSEKNDFLSLHELSGGTSEALSLALRFAVSQAFVAARTRQVQFVFLDEPFQMMDSERAAETLRLLRNLSPDLKQFLVIQPNFSEDERRLCDCRICTHPEATSLQVSCSGTGAREAAAPAILEPSAEEKPASHAVD